LTNPRRGDFKLGETKKPSKRRFTNRDREKKCKKIKVREEVGKRDGEGSGQNALHPL